MAKKYTARKMLKISKDLAELYEMAQTPSVLHVCGHTGFHIVTFPPDVGENSMGDATYNLHILLGKLHDTAKTSFAFTSDSAENKEIIKPVGDKEGKRDIPIRYIQALMDCELAQVNSSPHFSMLIRVAKNLVFNDAKGLDGFVKELLRLNCM
ncbi:MAG: hypothetical protein ACRCWH_07105 [Aeromonas veronii]